MDFGALLQNLFRKKALFKKCNKLKKGTKQTCLNLEAIDILSCNSFSKHRSNKANIFKILFR